MKRLALALALAATPALAEEVKLTGPEIRALLTTITAVGEGTTQTFEQTGATRYVSRGIPSAGRWWTAGDQYCSVWPPSATRTCYDVLRDGERLIWVGPDGGRTVNTIEPRGAE